MLVSLAWPAMLSVHEGISLILESQLFINIRVPREGLESEHWLSSTSG